MKLKALLLGSAASMIAVSGAHAADAVVAEPEAVEYVKVCDMYGAGYFYIPGTETCIKFSGEVRSTYSYDTRDVAETTTLTVVPGAADGDPAETLAVVTPGRSSTGSWSYRGRLNVETANESDYGTIRGYLRYQGDGNGGSDANVGLDRALISIGGLRIGYTDQYWTTNHGYGAPGPINDSSSFDQAIIADYTYAANGFAATIGVQDELGTTAGAENLDIYGGFNYGASWGTVAATIAYDGIAEEAAYRVSLSVTAIEGLEIKGIYAANFDNPTHFVTTGDWQWVVGVNYQATDAINVYASYFDQDTVDGSGFNVGVNWGFAPGIRVQAEANFYESDGEQYLLRVSRSF